MSAEKETTLSLDAFPTPRDLWSKYRAWKQFTSSDEKIVLQDYYEDGSGKEPRYYQRNAINATIEAIAKGQDLLPGIFRPDCHRRVPPRERRR